jgi:bacterioferritin
MSANLTSPTLDGMYPFLSEVADMRRRTRHHIQTRAADSPADLASLLNAAMVTELLCVARYLNHAARLGDSIEPAVRTEFLRYAREEQGHANALAERIRDLGAEAVEAPPLAPRAALYDDGEQLDADRLVDLLEEDMIAERIAIDSYREILQYVGAHDAATRRLIESILAVELTHAEELAVLRTEVLRRERLSGATSTRLPRLEMSQAVS